ncbi:MAG: hypothetical protein R3B45_02005 [Bdellovibrionota bacterium]
MYTLKKCIHFVFNIIEALAIVEKNYILLFISLIINLNFVTACGNKKNIEPPKKDNTGQINSNDATPKINYNCNDALSCPRVRLALTGTSIGGQADALMTWDIGATAPDDKQRNVRIVMENLLPGMQIISEPNENVIRGNWKPKAAQQGSLLFKARDMRRCQMMTGSSISCNDMSRFIQDYDQILEAPYQVVAKGETFDAGASEFFRQFHCEHMLSTDSDVYKATYAGSVIAAGAAAGAYSDNITVSTGYSRSTWRRAGSRPVICRSRCRLSS